MDSIPSNGKQGSKAVKQWKAGQRNIRYRRTLTGIDGGPGGSTTLEFDAPLFHWIDKNWDTKDAENYPQDAALALDGPAVYLFKKSIKVIENVGIEDIYAVASPLKKRKNLEWRAWTFTKWNSVKNGWAQRLSSKNFSYGLFASTTHTKHLTIRESRQLRPVSKITGSRRYSFLLLGQLNKGEMLYSNGGRHDYVTGHSDS